MLTSPPVTLMEYSLLANPWWVIDITRQSGKRWIPQRLTFLLRALFDVSPLFSPDHRPPSHEAWLASLHQHFNSCTAGSPSSSRAKRLCWRPETAPLILLADSVGVSERSSYSHRHPASHLLRPRLQLVPRLHLRCPKRIQLVRQ